MRLGISPTRKGESGYIPSRVTAAFLVCIPHFEGYFQKRLDVLKLSIASLLHNTRKGDFDLLVFDNGSCPEVVEYLSSLHRQGLIDYLLFSQRNIGKLAAMRIMFSAAPGEIVAYADDDIFFFPDWLPEHLKIFEAFENVGMVSGWAIRHTFGYGNSSCKKLPAKDNTVELREGRFLPGRWEYEFAQSTGRDPQKYLLDTICQKDIVLKSHGLEAYATADHFQFMSSKNVILKALPEEWSQRLMGGMIDLDERIDQAGYLRLSTIDRKVFHLGNVLDPWIVEYAESIGIDLQSMGIRREDYPTTAYYPLLSEVVEHCPLCGKIQSRRFSRIEDKGVTITNLICKSCGFVFMSPRMDAFENELFYSQEYRRMYQGSEQPVEQVTNVQEARANHLVEYLSLYRRKETGSVLDIGSSTGKLLQKMRSQGVSRVVGVEPGDAYRTYSSQDDLRIYQSLEALEDQESEGFDVIFMSHVLEHISDPVVYLNHLREKLLNDDGNLVVEVPNLYGHPSFEVAHQASFTPQTLRRIASQCGFQIDALKIHSIPHNVPQAYYITAILSKTEQKRGEIKTSCNIRLVRIRRESGIRGESPVATCLYYTNNWLQKKLAVRERYRQFLRIVQEADREIIPGELETYEKAVQLVEKNLQTSGPPILYFNASSHLTNKSFNALAGQAITWGLRLGGRRVAYVQCQGGLENCVLGVDKDAPTAPMPCGSCMEKNRDLYLSPSKLILAPDPDFTIHHVDFIDRVTHCVPETLQNFEFEGIPFGSICLPSVRWVMRKHQIDDDPKALQLLKAYIIASYRIARFFEKVISETGAEHLVVFNGSFFPEATTRFIANRRGLKVTTFEIGFNPYTTFLSDRIATEYIVNVPEKFELSEDNELRLDQYLSNRIKGNFTVGEIKFWKEIQEIPDWLIEKSKKYQKIVSVFTNVVFDTSQIYANHAFKTMFEWLDYTIRLAPDLRDTLFIIRAHPDEIRAGKQSRESVADWMRLHADNLHENVVFIGPDEYISSYALIQMSSLCLVYNSSIGLEGVILGKPVITAGRTRYSGRGIGYDIDCKDEYRIKILNILEGTEPFGEHQIYSARRFFYYSLFHNSINLSELIGIKERYEYHFKPNTLRCFSAIWSDEIRIILNGLQRGKGYAYPARAFSRKTGGWRRKRSLGEFIPPLKMNIGDGGRDLKEQKRSLVEGLISTNYSELEMLASIRFNPISEPLLVDVGAHVGSFTAPFAKKGWRVIAFEAESSNYAELSANLSGFSQVICENSLVSDKQAKDVPFYISQDHWDIHSLKPFHPSHTKRILRDTVCLKDYLEEKGISQVSMLKVDVEGADLLVLKGFDFNRIQPAIVMCEFMDERSIPNFGYGYLDVMNYMAQWDYLPFISEWGEIVEYGKKNIATHPHKFIGLFEHPLDHEPVWGNLIFVRRDHEIMFRETIQNYVWTKIEEIIPPVIDQMNVDTFNLILEADDIPSAIKLYRDRFNPGLSALIQINATQARNEGNSDLAEGLEALNDLVIDEIRKKAS